MMNKKPIKQRRLAIVDDEQGVCDFMGHAALGCGFEVFAATDPMRFLQKTKELEFHVVILDLHMPGVDGVELLRELAAQSSKAQIVLASGIGDDVMDSAFRLGRERGLHMAGRIHKPVRLHDLEILLQGLAPLDPVAIQSVLPIELTEGEFKLAIERNELVLHYQPQMDIKLRRIIGVEALIRWHHPRLGMLQPGTFLPRAESDGSIIPMTNWLYDKAIEQCGRWLKEGLRLRMSLNLSAKLPFEYEMPERLAAICAKNGCEPELITLELTETAAMDDPVRLIDVFTRLRIKGFHLSIDDFGTGYSSLIQLQRLPFSEMKVDKSFVLTMLESGASMVIIETIIAMAHSMRIYAVAEGVESAEALGTLADRGCDMAQGYFISRPVPCEQIPMLCQA